MTEEERQRWSQRAATSFQDLSPLLGWLMVVVLLVAELMGHTVAPVFVGIAGALVLGKTALKELRERGR